MAEIRQSKCGNNVAKLRHTKLKKNIFDEDIAIVIVG
jgi:hypothetical protein